MKAPQLSSATEQRLALPFAPDAQEEARTVLLSECGTNIPGWKSAGRERLHFAALKLSAGKLDKLQRAVNIAKIDFRDVLMAAGFGEPTDHISWFPEQKW